MKKNNLISLLGSSFFTLVIVTGLIWVLATVVNRDMGNAIERGEVVEDKETGELRVSVYCNDRLKKCIKIDNAFGVRTACIDNVIYFVKSQQPMYSEDGKIKQCHIVKIPVSERNTAFETFETLKPENIIKEEK